MKAFLTLILASSLSLIGLNAASAAKLEFHQGFEYTKLVPAQPTQVGANKIEVVEIFWYGCPHCFRFEPNLKKWLQTVPKNVSFIRIPAQFRPDWVLHAKAFYVAQLLKIEDKIHEAFFKEIHVNKNNLETKDKIIKFFKKFGVTEKQFIEAFDSFSVKSRIKQAKGLVKNYHISGVPTMIINGKYKALLDSNDNNFLRLLDHLIKKESKTPVNTQSN